jgi:hypothetical protein
MTTIALVTYEQFPAPALLQRRDLPAVVTGVDVYALAAAPLEDYDALFVGTGTDQRVLVELRPRLERFLAAGGTIVFCGHVAYPFLEGLASFVPLADYRLDDLAVHRVAPHPVFDGIEARDLSFRRGVAGFYGRGHNPPPVGAVVLNVLGPRRAPVDWLRVYPSGGALLVHAGIDLWVYGADDGGAAALPLRLVQWVCSRHPGTAP